MYRVDDYGRMISDRVRMDAYLRALRKAIKPGSVVLDIGTGTGIMALLACRLGAGRVYAIEPDDAIELGRETAIANGYAERIEFIQDMSTRVTLPERVDVIVSDIGGALPFFQLHIPSIIDARKRFLAPGGILIPQRHALWAAPVEAAELYRSLIAVWEGDTYGLNMLAARRIAVNRQVRNRVTPRQLLAEPRCWAALDYNAVDTPDITAETTWTATRRATTHGLAAWYDTTLADGISLSNAPGEPERPMHHSVFFPWTTPVNLTTGDTVSVTLRVNLVGDSYVWRWDTCVLDSQSNRIKADFKQSNFLGLPLCPTRLHKRASWHVPSLNEDGKIDRLALSLMNGKRSLEQIGKQVAAQFANRFPAGYDALTLVADLSEKYSGGSG